MKLLIIRHGDPDYSIDSLTPKGWKEADLLAKRIAPLPVAAYYVSPLGRAKDTASRTLQLAGRTAVECDWLREFNPLVHRPELPEGERRCAWDWLPADWLSRPALLDRDHWYEEPCFVQAGVEQEYRRVITAFDGLLASHGYVRDGLYYRAEKPNHDTLCLFCHFGVECVLLSHLMNVSPMVLWQGTVAAPSSVTTLYTEERREGIAAFRMASFGDISHLYAGGEPPAFAARFCECYTDTGDRHD